MAGLGRISLGVLILCLLTTSRVDAFGSRLGWWSTPATTSYYYAAPATTWVVPSYYYYYCPPLIVTPTPRVIPVPDAKPTAAPPSATSEPPLQKKASNDPRMPMIVTSHAMGSNSVPSNIPLAKDRCRVGFWNLSGREVTVVIDGKSRTLAKDRAVTLDLERQFSWQIEGQPQHLERVGEGQATLELVIRE